MSAPVRRRLHPVRRAYLRASLSQPPLGKIRAEGWFQRRDGVSWCPEHLPAWVEPWRKARAS